MIVFRWAATGPLDCVIIYCNVNNHQSVFCFGDCRLLYRYQISGYLAGCLCFQGSHSLVWYLCTCMTSYSRQQRFLPVGLWDPQI